MPDSSAGRRLLATIGIVLAIEIVFGSRPVAQSNAANPLAREIFKELIEIPTTAADGTAKAAQAIAKRLIAAGFAAEDAQILGPDPRTPLVVARYRGTDPAAKPVLFMAHMDVVPARREDWSVDPWVLLEREGWFYGRGTSDNKTGVTSIVANLVRLKGEGWRPRRDLIVLLTGDEETTAAGLEWLLAERRALVDAELAVNTDSGGVIVRNGKPVLFTVQASEKVYADYQLEVTDAGGHSSLARADNPIYTLAAALQRFAAHQFPLNITDVARGVLRAFRPRRKRTAGGRHACGGPAVAGRCGGRASLRQSFLQCAAAVRRALRRRSKPAMHRTPCRKWRAPTSTAAFCRAEPTADIEATIRRLAGDRVKVTVAQPPQPSPASPVSPAILGRFENWQLPNGPTYPSRRRWRQAPPMARTPGGLAFRLTGYRG